MISGHFSLIFGIKKGFKSIFLTLTRLKKSWNKFCMFIIIFSRFLSYQGFSPCFLNFTAHFCPEISSIKILTIIPCLAWLTKWGEVLEEFVKTWFFLVHKNVRSVTKPPILKLWDLLKIVYNGLLLIRSKIRLEIEKEREDDNAKKKYFRDFCRTNYRAVYSLGNEPIYLY